MIDFLTDGFYGNRGSSVFAQFGTNVKGAKKAVDAFTDFGSFDIEVKPLYSLTNGSVRVVTPMHGIYNNDRFLGAVTGKYVAVQPKTFAELWDNHIDMPINAMGTCNKNSSFFISSELPDMNIGGDVVKNYLIGISPMTGLGAIRLFVSPTRLKCTNMLPAAKRTSSITARIPHVGRVNEMVKLWMKDIKSKMIVKAQTIEDELKLMNSVKATPELLEKFMNEFYELPKPLSRIAPMSVLARRDMEFDRKVNMVTNRRETFISLYNGAMTKGDELDNTLYKMLNAAGENEQYRRSTKDIEARAESAIFGTRADLIERAYEITLQLAQN